MEKCIFCGAPTSFKFEGDGDFKDKNICPKCQSEKIGTTFLGCSNKDDCSIKIERKND
jgi:hypothetical protein